MSSKLAVLIALNVVRKDNAFLSTHEEDGWYLPAGGVDPGETFSTGALRETMEEAECAAVLAGVHRIEVCFDHPRMNRFRVVFGSRPSDPNAKVKSVPSDDSLEAEWVTTSALSKRRLRSREALNLFRWVESGAAPLLPLSLVRGTDSPVVRHEARVAVFEVSSVVVVPRARDGGDGDVKSQPPPAVLLNDDRRLPRAPLGLPGVFSLPQEIAAMQCEEVGTTLVGFIGLSVKPPRNKEDESALISFVFAGAPLTDVAASAKGHFSWRGTEDIVADDPHVREIASEYATGKIVPVSVGAIVQEGTRYA